MIRESQISFFRPFEHPKLLHMPRLVACMLPTGWVQQRLTNGHHTSLLAAASAKMLLLTHLTVVLVFLRGLLTLRCIADLFLSVGNPR